MTRTTLVLAALLVALAARPAAAQGLGMYNPPAQPYTQPPVSPYLNLFRGGPPGINYYADVLPKIDTQRYIQQQELLTAQQQAHPASVTTATGHPTRFMSYSQYFMSQGGGAAPGSGPQTITAGAAQATTAQTTQRLGAR